MKIETLLAALIAFVSLIVLNMSELNFGDTWTTCHALTPPARLDILSHVTAAKKRVTLLDLCDQTDMSEEYKALLAKDDIGPAPAAGTEKFIQSEQLKSHIKRYLAARGYDASQVEISVPDRVVIARQSIEIPKEQIESIYRDFILSKTTWNPLDVEVHSIYFSGKLELPAGAMTYETTANSRERFIGNVGLTINFLIDGERERSVQVTGKVDLLQNVVHAARPLKRGEVISDTDISIERVNIADAPDRFTTQTDQVVGKRLVRDVGVHQPINLADLDEPLAFKRGSAVTIIYSQPGLKLTAKGQARENGTVGNTVRITNVMTNRTIFCRVLDDTTVQAVP
jgi:flagellar basal body P-ring formation protein FlgA